MIGVAPRQTAEITSYESEPIAADFNTKSAGPRNLSSRFGIFLHVLVYVFEVFIIL